MSAFLNVFDGYQERHIELTGSPIKNERGKMEARLSTVDGPITDDLAEHHMIGTAAVGVAPIKSDSTCMWGVLDFDYYDMPQEVVEKIKAGLNTKCAAFRSKSNGLHVYVFADEPVSGKHMHQYLLALRKRMPKECINTKHGRDIEVFPKQSQVVVTPNAEPTAVNLPLRGTQRALEFLIDEEGPKTTLNDTDSDVILTHIDERCRVAAEMFQCLADETPVLDTSEMGYAVPNNPAGRNDLLLRIGMSMQARGWPDLELEAELFRLNRDAHTMATGDETSLMTIYDTFVDDGPLTQAEVNNIVKAVKKREKGNPTSLNFRVVDKFNQRWSKITINGEVEFVDKQSNELTTFKKHMLFDETSDQVVRVGKATVLLAQLWLRDPDHARYNGVCMEPLPYDGDAFNVWRGFKVAPKRGDATVFEDYILNILCGGDKGLAHWLTMYLADAVQRPTEPSPPTAVALRGKQGAGKSFLQERILEPMFGARYVHKVQTASRMFSQFNRSMFGATFVIAEEAIFHGSKQTAATLKDFISSPEWRYEEKYKASFPQKNVHRLIASTNETQAVHLDHDDRRWTVIDVAQPFDMTTTDGQQSARAFWEPYHAFVRSEDGLSIILDYLLTYQVDRHALLFGYGTAAKARDKMASDPLLSVLHEMADSGVCLHDRKASGTISNKSLLAAVHAAGGREMNALECAHRLRSLIPRAETSRKAQFCPRVVTQVGPDGLMITEPLLETRQRGFEFGTLDEFRADVARITQEVYDGEVDAWQAWLPEARDFSGWTPPEGDDVPF